MFGSPDSWLSPRNYIPFRLAKVVAPGPLVALRTDDFRRTVRYAYTFRRCVCDSIEWHLVSIGRYPCPRRRNSTLPNTTPCVPASVEHGLASADIRRRSYGTVQSRTNPWIDFSTVHSHSSDSCPCRTPLVDFMWKSRAPPYSSTASKPCLTASHGCVQ